METNSYRIVLVLIHWDIISVILGWFDDCNDNTPECGRQFALFSCFPFSLNLGQTRLPVIFGREDGSGGHLRDLVVSFRPEGPERAKKAVIRTNRTGGWLSRVEQCFCILWHAWLSQHDQEISISICIGTLVPTQVLAVALACAHFVEHSKSSRQKQYGRQAG